MLVRYAAIVKRIRAVQSASKIGGKGERYMLPGLAEKLWVCELIMQNVHDLQVRRIARRASRRAARTTATFACHFPSSASAYAHPPPPAYFSPLPHLQEIKRTLADFLNQQRAQCPRMFLMSDTDMIPLVAADTTRYESLEPHLSMMFPAASRLVVDHTTHCALGFESSNCGSLPFVEAIAPLNGEGMQVNVMVDALVAASHLAMRAATLKAEAALEPALQPGARIRASGQRVAGALEALPVQAVALAWMARCCKAVDVALNAAKRPSTPSSRGHDVALTLLTREMRTIDLEVAGVVLALKTQREKARALAERQRLTEEANGAESPRSGERVEGEGFSGGDATPSGSAPGVPGSNTRPVAALGKGSRYKRVMRCRRVMLGLEVMLAVLLHDRALVARFIAGGEGGDGRPAADDFAWTSQLRAELRQTGGNASLLDLKLGTVGWGATVGAAAAPVSYDSRANGTQAMFCIGSAQLAYGWEWMGCHQRIVLAPHTLRVMRSIAEVSVAGEAALVRGPTGSCQTETIRDLAWLLGRVCFAVAVAPMVCSNAAAGSDTITAAVARILQAAVANGGWAIIEGADLLPTPSMVAVGHMLPRIRRAHLGKLSRVKILDATPMVLPGFGVFATTDVTVPGGGPDGWADAFEATVWAGAMHVVVSAIPDVVPVCVVRMVAHGVAHADALALARRLGAALASIRGLLSAGDATRMYGRAPWGLATTIEIVETALCAVAAAVEIFLAWAWL